MNFYTVLTNSGISAIIKARASNEEVKLSTIAVGDGEIVPSQIMEGLQSEKHRFNINTITQDSTNPGYLVIEGIIPSTVGGFYISEVALYTDDNILFAIGSLPRTYKPLLEEGSAKDLTIKMIIEVTNADSVSLKIDDSVVLASRKFVEDTLENYMLTSNAVSKTEFETMLASYSLINKPTIISPANFTTDYIGAVTSTYSTSSSYEGLQTRVVWECALDANFNDIIDRYEGSDNLTSWTPTIGLALTQVFIRTKQISDGHISDFSDAISFTTPNIFVQPPTITVEGAPNDIKKNAKITLSEFTIYNGTDEHLSTDYQILKNSDGSLVWESPGNTVDKLTITSGDLVESTEYRFRARHNSTNYGSSAWVEVIGTTKSQFTPTAGIQGTKGFSVAPTDQPFALLGLAEMTGTNDPESDNYGNYIHTNGSIVCWLTKTFYRVGHPDSPRYVTYGENALDMVGTDVFATEAEANASGYALPRCFINNGKEQPGVFVDKYMNSKDGNSASKSVFGGVPISLATTAGYTVSNGMTGCTGILADAVVLSKARGERWNCTSAFIYGYLALVSVAQAQAATSTADVAWYDPTGVKNYPKGCNNNALSDVDDTTVVYASAGDSGNANKPKTGATANFAKTTHNGSNNGVADLNGGMLEATIGITNFGSSATASTNITNDTIYVLKHSTDIATLTAGWNGATDVWGDAANLATKYDSVTSPHPLGSSTGNAYWGNGTNAVLQNDLSGVNRDVCGFIPKNSSSTGATGANLFGNDYMYKQNIQNMVPLTCGAWNNSADAGVFYRSFNNCRSSSYYFAGFRASAYFA